MLGYSADPTNAALNSFCMVLRSSREAREAQSFSVHIDYPGQSHILAMTLEIPNIRKEESIYYYPAKASEF